MISPHCVYVVYFCFKQKTAYEMSISDWSSDVCSSDLEEVARARIPTPAVHPRDQLHRGRVDMEPVTIDKLVADMEAENLGDHDGRRLGFDRLEQIGSASCRAECVRTCRSRWSPYH